MKKFSTLFITALLILFTTTLAQAESKWVNCSAANVGVFKSRIHVKCNESYSGISYFAYPTSDAASAARFLSILSAANLSGRTIQVLYNPADFTSATSYGCMAGDCRPFTALLLY